jgi:hypothetical protein
MRTQTYSHSKQTKNPYAKHRKYNLKSNLETQE